MRKAKSSNVPAILFTVLCGALVVFLIWFFFGNSLFSTVKTATITSANFGQSHPVRAVVVRDEIRMDEENVTSISYLASEGGALYKGSRIAEIYSSGYSQTDMNKLINTRSEIKNRIAELLETAYSDPTLDNIDSQILEYANHLFAVIHGNSQGSLRNLENQLSSAMENRMSHLTSKYASDQTLSKLTSTESSYEEKISSWTRSYLADRDCLVSFYTDGYENMLTFDAADTLGIAEVKTVLGGIAPAMSASEKGKTSIFREIYESGWYLLALSTEEDWNPVAGQSYQIHLEGFDDQPFTATVSSTAQAGGDLLIRFFVAGSAKPVLNLRTASATVSEAHMAELCVPLRSIRMREGKTYVVLPDGGGRGVEIQIISRDDSNAYIRSLESGFLSEGQKVVLYNDLEI